MSYFDDIQFISARELARCDVHVDTVIEDMYSLEYIAAGAMYYSRDGTPMRTLAGPCLHWHGPGHAYRYGPAEGQRWHHLYFTFRGPRAQRVIETGMDALAAEGFLHVLSRERVLRWFRDIIAEVISRRLGYVSRACASIEAMLSQLEADVRRAGLVPDSRQRMESILDAIVRQPERNLTAEQAASDACLSTSHFRKLFRAYTGKAFHHYLLETRMYYAARRLAEPDTSIKDLAEELGYTELAEFSRVFRRTLGVCPRRYRSNLLSVSAG